MVEALEAAPCAISSVYLIWSSSALFLGEIVNGKTIEFPSSTKLFFRGIP